MLKSNKSRAITLMISSAFFVALLQVLIRMTGGDIPLMQQTFFMDVVMMIFMFCLIKKKGGISLLGRKEDQKILIARSAGGLLATITLFYASSHAAQADVSILGKMSPFIVTILAVTILKEKLPKIQIPALIIAFAGAYFVADPRFNSNLFPLAIAFLSAVITGGTHTILAYAKGKIHPLTIVMHFSTFGTIVCLPFVIADFVVPDMTQLLLLLSLGFVNLGNHLSLTNSYRFAPAAEVGIFNYTGIIFSIILGFIMLQEIPTANSLLGGALIITSAVLVYVFGTKKEVVEQKYKNY